MVEAEDTMSRLEVNTVESEFTHWNELSRQLKIEILRNLPYSTLRKFMFLSKECFELVSSVETEVFAAHLYDSAYVSSMHDAAYGRNPAEVVVWYISPNDPKKRLSYELLFTEDEHGGYTVRRVKDSEEHKVYGKGTTYANQTSFTAAVRYFFKLTSHIKATELSFEIGHLNPDLECILKQQTAEKFSCNTFRIRTDDRDLPPLLYPLIPTGCVLHIFTDPSATPDNIFVDSSYFDLELIRAAPMFLAHAYVGVTDEQLPNLQGYWFWMKAPYISCKAVNELLLQWAEDKRRITDICLMESQRIVLDKTQLLKGLEDYVITEDELRQVGTERCYHQPEPPFLHFGLRNRSGCLIVVIVAPDHFHLFDPYADINDDHEDDYEDEW